MPCAGAVWIWNVSASPSTSLACSAIPTPVSSSVATDCGAATGASSTGRIWIATVAMFDVRYGSLTENCTESSPK